ncbi:MAG: cysteine peptidase family C39 domain-containing protein [Nanoarchaeota archaeon]|nr:cysteine peptidase family C39 domain-containing protein [Nanoarchaeota archaeon]
MIKYYQQEEDWSCGPAVVRMVLSSFKIKKSEAEISKTLGSNKEIGTPNKRLVDYFKDNNFSFIAEENAKINDLRRFFSDKFNIIVNYYCASEKEGHFAIVKSLDKKRIYLYDPAMGEDHSYSLKYFNKIWYGKSGEKKWLLAVGEKLKN